jgi:hypothetical protein
MMHKTSLAAALLASAAQAITIYSINDCGADPNNGELLSFNFDVDAKIEIVDGQKQSSCNFANIVLPDWPQKVSLNAEPTVYLPLITQTGGTLPSLHRSDHRS